MPHIKGLNILNDCEENQRLVRKLPDWAAARWNRQATQFMKDSGEFPSFKDFAQFMSSEAEIVCNPITSFHALRSSDTITAKTQKEKRPACNVLHTQTATETDSSTYNKPNVKLPCMLCQEEGHKLHSCPQFKGKSLDERRKYIKEKKLLKK